MSQILVKRLHPSAILPRYMSSGAAGCDVTACLEAPIELAPLGRAAVPTGLALEIPEGFEVQVRPRSGLAIKKGLTIVNAPGTIDSDYRGELKVLLVNLSTETVRVENGERIAQLIMQKVEQAEWAWTEELSATERGVGGFGSTGVISPVLFPTVP
jgi:dUTP pyrophosphatase